MEQDPPNTPPLDLALFRTLETRAAELSKDLGAVIKNLEGQMRLVMLRTNKLIVNNLG